VFGSTWEQDFPIWKSTNPTKDDWKIAVDTLKVGAWDPAFIMMKIKINCICIGDQAMNGHY
jgi:hypothetical protein